MAGGLRPPALSHPRRFRCLRHGRQPCRTRPTIPARLIQLSFAKPFTTWTIPKLFEAPEGPPALRPDDREVTAIYDRHGYDGDKRKASLSWDRRMREIALGTADDEKVVILHAS